MSKNIPTDLNLKAKELCNLGICISMSEARRVITQLPQKKLDQIIEKKIKGENESCGNNKFGGDTGADADFTKEDPI